MKCFRMVLRSMMIFLVILFLVFFARGKSSPSHIKIHKNKVTIYNDNEEIIDKHVLKEKIKDYAIGDINGDKQVELIILTGSSWIKYGKNLIIFSLEDEIKEIGRKDFTKLNPWKLAIGDIDGDGKDEISIGVYKKSPFHQVMAKRPFIYSFTEGKIQPKWRGSRLSRPFIDYNFCDIDGDGIDEIVAIETLQDNRKLINSYKWKGFGFEGYVESKSCDDIKELIIEEGLVYIRVKEEKDSYKGLLKIENNTLKIERVD